MEFEKESAINEFLVDKKVFTSAEVCNIEGHTSNIVAKEGEEMNKQLSDINVHNNKTMSAYSDIQTAGVIVDSEGMHIDSAPIQSVITTKPLIKQELTGDIVEHATADQLTDSANTLLASITERVQVYRDVLDTTDIVIKQHPINATDTVVEGVNAALCDTLINPTNDQTVNTTEVRVEQTVNNTTEVQVVEANSNTTEVQIVEANSNTTISSDNTLHSTTVASDKNSTLQLDIEATNVQVDDGMDTANVVGTTQEPAHTANNGLNDVKRSKQQVDVRADVLVGYRGDDELSADSDSSSSSDSDTSVCLTRRKKKSLCEDYDDEEDGPRKRENTVKTKGEYGVEDLPPIEELKITVDESVTMVHIGSVSAILGVLVIVQGKPELSPLNSDSVLFLQNRDVLGKVFETIGPVKMPFYTVRFNCADDIGEKAVTVGQLIYYAPQEQQFTNFVFMNQLTKERGSDASWEHNNEPPVRYMEFSDDEAEHRARAKQRNKHKDDEGDTSSTSNRKRNRANKDAKDSENVKKRQEHVTDEARPHTATQQPHNATQRPHNAKNRKRQEDMSWPPRSDRGTNHNRPPPRPNMLPAGYTSSYTTHNAPPPRSFNRPPSMFTPPPANHFAFRPPMSRDPNDVQFSHQGAPRPPPAQYDPYPRSQNPSPFSNTPPPFHSYPPPLGQRAASTVEPSARSPVPQLHAPPVSQVAGYPLPAGSPGLNFSPPQDSEVRGVSATHLQTRSRPELMQCPQTVTSHPGHGPRYSVAGPAHHPSSVPYPQNWGPSAPPNMMHRAPPPHVFHQPPVNVHPSAPPRWTGWEGMGYQPAYYMPAPQVQTPPHFGGPPTFAGAQPPPGYAPPHFASAQPAATDNVGEVRSVSRQHGGDEARSERR